MKRVLVLPVILFLAACSNPGKPPLSTPEAAAAIPRITPPSKITPIPSVSTIAPTPMRASAAAFPDTSAYQWTAVVTGLVSPVDIQFPNDGTGRMFIVEQAGRIRIVENGQLLETPFLDIVDRVGSEGNEQGLLGLAFHPDFRDNGNFYVNYTDKNGNTVIARFHAQGDLTDPASESRLLRVAQPFPNHNGGGLVFGPDGYLYIGLGDGGSQGDPSGNGQNLNTLLGKLLRIDVDHGSPYAVPGDNPFATGGGKPEIWAYGLRNPWRFSFDRATRDLYIADVGQDTWEEIDFIPAASGAGSNFGWNYFEGSHPYQGASPAGIQFQVPVAEYSHAEGGCAVTGGYVYRGALTEWQGVYLHGDFCSGKVWGLVRSRNGWQYQILFETGFNITSFGQDTSGEIYLADRAGGIYRLGK